MSADLSLVIADDHALIRRGLVEVIAADSTFAILGEASDGASAMSQIELHRPAIAVLDLQMPKMSGLEVASEIMKRGIPTRVVLLTAFDTRDLLDRALALGVAGYLLKDAAATDILACLHMVASGRTYLAPTIANHLVAERSAPRGGGAVERLTPAERRVLRLVSEAKTTDAIAAELGLSPKTIENHRAHISARLGLRGANALLKFAVEHRSELADQGS
jgi:DNA-binding NarL/FixJ family response regulator